MSINRRIDDCIKAFKSDTGSLPSVIVLSNPDELEIGMKERIKDYQHFSKTLKSDTTQEPVYLSTDGPIIVMASGSDKNYVVGLTDGSLVKRFF
jgi:hypothetical protein